MRDRLDRLPLAVKRMTDPPESLARRGAERVIDIDEILQRANVSALVDRVDVNDIMPRVDAGALLDRVDMNDLVQRLEMDALVGRADLKAVIAGSSGGMASEALDPARSQPVGFDGFICRWVQRALRRKHPARWVSAASVDGQPLDCQPPAAGPLDAEPPDAQLLDAGEQS